MQERQGRQRREADLGKDVLCCSKVNKQAEGQCETLKEITLMITVISILLLLSTSCTHCSPVSLSKSRNVQTISRYWVRQRPPALSFRNRILTLENNYWCLFCRPDQQKARPHDTQRITIMDRASNNQYISEVEKIPQIDALYPQ